MIEKNQHLYDSPNSKGFNLRHRQKLLFSAPTTKQIQKTQNSYPPQRINHASVFYKNKIYVIGGSIKNNNNKTNPLYLYAYELEIKKWRRFLTKTTSKQFVNLSGQLSALMGNKWFLWGGVDEEENCVSQLWKLNLENYQWVKCEQKGDTPYPNEGGLLIGHQKNWLLHYEGINNKLNRHEHYAYLYSIQSKNWFQCKGNYQWIIKNRIGASICSQNNKIYLFGGLRILENDVEYLNDFYEITVQNPNKTSDAVLYAKKIDTSFKVSPRSEAFLFPIGKQTICLLGGRNQSQFQSNLCIFNFKNRRWIQDNYFQTKLIQRTGVSCIQGGQEFYIFGGGIEQMNSLSYMNDLWSLKISSQRLNHLIQESFEEEINSQCDICLQKKMNFMFLSKDSSSQMITEYKKEINFPFSAFALLIDNSFLLGAGKISIYIDKDETNCNYIRIEDDGKNTWAPHEFLLSMQAYCSINTGIITGCDKKIRKNIQRSNQLKQFGVNIKLGSLRLGKRFLYITQINHQKHVFLCTQTSKTPFEQQENYSIYYYSFDPTTKLLSQQQMNASKSYIQAEYKRYILYATSICSNIKNYLLIFDTILDNPEQQIKIRPEKNDIYLGNQEVIRQIQQKGYNLADCIDVSLRSYLSSLYLKNQSTIYLSFKTPTLINMQGNLQIIDKLCKQGCAIELDGLIQFDFKMAEFYYLRQAKKNNNFFSNGVLLYYRNRLISRYKIQLGEMIHFLKDNHEHSSIKLPMIGFADLPENVPVNASKTSFVFSVMLQKMYSRFKFVEETFSSRSKLFLPSIQLPQPKPRKNTLDDDQYEASDLNNHQDKRQRRAKKSKKRRNDNLDDYQSHIRKIQKKDQRQQMSHSAIQNLSGKNNKISSYDSQAIMEQKNSQKNLEVKQGNNAQHAQSIENLSSNLLKEKKEK